MSTVNGTVSSPQADDFELHEVEYVQMPVSKLNPARYNPPSRTHDEALEELVESVKVVRHIHAIIVTPDGDVIEGHRRLQTAKILGIKKLWCCIYRGDPELLYAYLNVNQKRHTATETLWRYVYFPHTLTPNQLANHARMARKIKASGVEELLKYKGSLNYYKHARYVARYAGLLMEEHVMAVVRWFHKHNAYMDGRKWKEKGLSPTTLMRCIVTDKPLPATSKAKKRGKAKVTVEV